MKNVAAVLNTIANVAAVLNTIANMYRGHNVFEWLSTK